MKSFRHVVEDDLCRAEAEVRRLESALEQHEGPGAKTLKLQVEAARRNVASFKLSLKILKTGRP